MGHSYFVITCNGLKCRLGMALVLLIGLFLEFTVQITPMYKSSNGYKPFSLLF